MLLIFIISCLLCYCLGSIPFALLTCNIFGISNIRSKGSGNIGATNVARNSNLFIGSIVFLLDFFKGFISFIVASSFFNHTQALQIALFSVIGHIFSICLKMKGGKGIATFFGVIASYNIFYFIVLALFWLVALYTIRMVSLASLIMVFSASLIYLCTDTKNFIPIMTISIVIILAHSSNIRLILDGNERTVKIFK